MSSSRCTSCGLIHQPGQCQQQTSTAGSDKPMDITPTCCCNCYLSIIGLFLFVYLLFVVGISKLDGPRHCFVELFANSVTVSNANVSAADWRVGFVARSPVTGCKVSILALNSRLLRGVEVISNSSTRSLDYFVKEDKTDVVFEKIVMQVIGEVIWNIRVEVIFGMNIDAQKLNGYLIASCPAIPVKFTTDPAGKVMGSLLGNMRRCDYIFRHNLA